MRDSDLILFIKDANDDGPTEEIDFSNKDVFHVTNKIDLLKEEEKSSKMEEKKYHISCKESIGIDHLLNEISNQVKNK